MARLWRATVWNEQDTEVCNNGRGAKASKTDLLLIQVHGIVDGLPCNLSKDCVLAIKVIAAVHADEKLAVVCMRCVLICACHQAPACMFISCL